MTSIVTPEATALNNVMLDDIKAVLRLKNDAALSRVLEAAPPVVSKIRHGHLPIGDSLIITIHELTGWAPRDIKAHLGRTCLAQLS